jgi:hypothetical protein
MAPKYAWLSAALCFSAASASSGQQPLKGLDQGRGYNFGEPIPVSCLNRTMYVYNLRLG